MDFIQEYVLAFASSYAVLPLIFILCYIDGFFPPLPSETVLISLGSLAASTGNVYILWILFFGSLGAWLGDITAYHIGRHIPIYRIPFLNSEKGIKTIDWAERSLASRGVFLILVARFVPVGRVAVNMVAGATGYSRLKFIVTAFFAALIWSCYSVFLGYGAGAILENRPILAVVVGVSLGITFGFVLDKIFSFLGNRLARYLAGKKSGLLAWVKVDDILGQGIALDEDLISGKECSCKRNDDSSSQAQEKFESASCDCAEDKGGKTFDSTPNEISDNDCNNDVNHNDR